MEFTRAGTILKFSVSARHGFQNCFPDTARILFFFCWRGTARANPDIDSIYSENDSLVGAQNGSFTPKPFFAPFLRPF